ncbi:alanine racemase [Gilvimarinus sp. F26214L]|uniref:alanine racemase n=1 Tax=Gilvimarinus sp. DZF01 TaxID=3461371 RepID=UPI004045A0D1
MNRPPRNELQIDLQAIIDNWRSVTAHAPHSECAAVVKADAYGLGSGPVVSALADSGCRGFFVATLEEALAIAPLLREGSRVYIFHGVAGVDLDECRRHGFIPVLSTLPQVQAWASANRREGRIHACALQVDTGMNRLGLGLNEWRQVAESVSARELGGTMVMSHLACAEDRLHPLNQQQRARFQAVVVEARQWAPGIKASLANSAGVLLGPDYHFDQVRPGIALYGGNPAGENGGPFRPVVRLRLPVLQLRRVGEDGSVGYGATAPVRAGALLATVQGGYADGLMIAQSRAGEGEVSGVRVPVVGRISMDLTVFDVSGVPASAWNSTDPYIEVLNENLGIEQMARAANTISYEVLTRLGRRFDRKYLASGTGAKQNNELVIEEQDEH